jgi:hypothetical protein
MKYYKEIVLVVALGVLFLPVWWFLLRLAFWCIFIAPWRIYR